MGNGATTVTPLLRGKLARSPEPEARSLLLHAVLPELQHAFNHSGGNNAGVLG
jgi:hypothetical protein